MSGPDTTPPPSDDGDGESLELAEAIATVLRQTERTLAVAESLTCGALALQLGAASRAAQWFAGGVVAYSPSVKFALLGVEPGPVVSADCATQMARGVARLTEADFAVAATGVGGPDPQEGRAAGTVFVAVSSAGHDEVAEHHFTGRPAEVVASSVRAALRMLRAELAR